MNLTARTEKIEWTARDLHQQREFRVFYSDRGVPIQARYETDTPDDSLTSEKDVATQQKLVAQINHSIVGIPEKPAPLPLGAYLEKCREVAYPEKAQRILIQYVLYSTGGTIQPAVIVKLWGGGSGDGFEVVDRIRVVFFLDDGGMQMDNRL